MFCPHIKKDCRGEDCVMWSKPAGKCYYVAEREAREEMQKTQTKLVDEMHIYNETNAQIIGYYRLLWKIQVASMKRDPTIPEEVKKALESAEDAETAEKLLKDAGLM